MRPPARTGAPGRRPVIGVVAATAPSRWSVWDQPAVVVARNYVDAVQLAGGAALVVPTDPAGPSAVLDVLDAVMLTGGTDVDPALYGAAPHAETEPPDAVRDAFEMDLVRRALDRDIPLLGICRGIQVMSVAMGGTLHQHLPEHLGHQDHRRRVGTFDDSEHVVVMEPGSVAERVAGERRHVVRSHHHQGVDRVGEGLVVTGRAGMDGLPEAIEAPGRRFALGVQWHPEADALSPVIAALVEAARR